MALKIGAIMGAAGNSDPTIEKDVSILQQNATYAELADPNSRMTPGEAKARIGAARKQEMGEVAQDLDTAAEGIEGGVALAADTTAVVQAGIGALRVVARRPVTVNCFPANTLIDTETGLGAIAHVAPGDRVWSFDFKSGVWQLATVDARHDADYDGPLVRIELGAGTVDSTAYHPFWVIEGECLENRSAVRHIPPTEDRGQSLPGRWVNSHELLASDIVFIRSVGPTQILRVTERLERTRVCNLTIRGLHTFCVGGARILVHNVSGSGGLETPSKPPEPVPAPPVPPGSAACAGRSKLWEKCRRENQEAHQPSARTAAPSERVSRRQEKEEWSVFKKSSSSASDGRAASVVQLPMPARPP